MSSDSGYWSVSGYGSAEPQYDQPEPVHNYSDTAHPADVAIAVTVVAAALVILGVVLHKQFQHSPTAYQSMEYAGHAEQAEQSV